jgi:hypothetical protein
MTVVRAEQPGRAVTSAPPRPDGGRAHPQAGSTGADRSPLVGNPGRGASWTQGSRFANWARTPRTGHGRHAAIRGAERLGHDRPARSGATRYGWRAARSASRRAAAKSRETPAHGVSMSKPWKAPGTTASVHGTPDSSSRARRPGPRRGRGPRSPHRSMRAAGRRDPAPVRPRPAATRPPRQECGSRGGSASPRRSTSGSRRARSRDPGPRGRQSGRRSWGRRATGRRGQARPRPARSARAAASPPPALAPPTVMRPASTEGSTARCCRAAKAKRRQAPSSCRAVPIM